MIQHNALKRCQDAIQIQDACNPNGVAYSCMEHLAELRKVPVGHDEVEADEAMRLLIFKLADLFHVSDVGMRDYIKLEQACKQVIDEAKAEATHA